MSRLITRCVYCGSASRLTKEHVFGRWHKDVSSPLDYMPPGTRTLHKTRHSRFNCKQINGFGRFNRPGKPGSHQLKIACEECNKGWMGRMQSAVKPAALRLALGGLASIREGEQHAIANWVTMAAMSYEFADINTQIISQEERTYLKDFDKPPKNHSILIAEVLPSEANFCTWHRVTKYYSRHNTNLEPEGFEATYFQTTIFNLGSVIFISISGEERLVGNAIFIARSGGILPLWTFGKSENVTYFPVKKFFNSLEVGTDIWVMVANVLDNPRLAFPPP